MTFLPMALASLSKQTNPAATVLCIDDCSTDGSQEFIAQKCRTTRNLRLLRLEERVNAPQAANLAIMECETSLLAFNDQDDISRSDRLARQAGFFQSVDMQVPRIVTSFFTRKRVSLNAGIQRRTGPVDAEEIYLSLLFLNPIGFSTIMLNVEAWRNADLRFSSQYPLAYDYDLWCHALLRKIAVNCLPRFLVDITEHSNQSSRLEDGAAQATQFRHINQHFRTSLFPSLGSDITWNRLSELPQMRKSFYRELILPKDEFMMKITKGRALAAVGYVIGSRAARLFIPKLEHPYREPMEVPALIGLLPDLIIAAWKRFSRFAAASLALAAAGFRGD